MTSRELKQQAFIRVCRDSQFTLDATRAAVLAAAVINCHPLEIWLAMPDLDAMDGIAAGRAQPNPNFGLFCQPAT